MSMETDRLGETEFFRILRSLRLYTPINIYIPTNITRWGTVFDSEMEKTSTRYRINYFLPPGVTIPFDKRLRVTNNARARSTICTAYTRTHRHINDIVFGFTQYSILTKKCPIIELHMCVCV